MHRFVGVLGMIVLVGLAFLFSTDRRAIRYKTVAWGLGLQIVFAYLVLRWSGGRAAFAWMGQKVDWFLNFANYGSTFVFGPLAQNTKPWGVVFAFQVLPAIIFIAAVFALLYYLGIMQIIIRGAAIFMTKLMAASGAESLNVAASIFMGQTEAPLTIRPFLPDVTQSELMTIMTSGMAHVSGGIMAAYIAFGIKAEHLLAAVIMTAPGTILLSKMLVPETEKPLTAGRVQMAEMERDTNALAAIARGTTDGLNLAVNVAAMLISFIALIYLIDGIFGGIHAHLLHWFPSSLEQIFGWILSPIAWLIGIPWKEAPIVGNLLGLRMATNELIAYQRLGPMA
ncbi:MAG TPA: nucleoside transporter C-terminal domain-containing protein, partial [Candidatus Acidoferrales bacterium]|nr:nucleoside transporter C-terminal domain-containing protein [Candidatus Acidoferrales bacterium]